jgi:hypothetical protein
VLVALGTLVKVGTDMLPLVALLPLGLVAGVEVGISLGRPQRPVSVDE